MVKIACANEYWTNNAKSILESLRKGMRMAEWKVSPGGGGGGTWVFFGWVRAAGTPNWHPVPKKKPKSDAPF